MSATISASTNVTHNAIVLNGVLSSIPAGGSARFRYGNGNGGPYGSSVIAAPYANGNVSASLSGLLASATYYYVLEILDSSGNVVATSAQGSVTTLVHPSAVISPPTNIRFDGARINGILYNVPSGGSARFRYGTVSGVYTLTANALPYANGVTSAIIAGLNPVTTYYYILEILDSSGNVVATSNQGVVTTIAQPVATCLAATGESSDGLTFRGSIQNIPVGGFARFRYGTANGGPYVFVVSATPYANGNVSAFVSGLLSGTTYYYVLEILDSGGNVLVVSSQCSGLTSGAAASATNKDALLVKLCSITGIVPMRNCATNEVILFVHVATSDGDLIPTTSTEFPATGTGAFGVMGYFRSYYADKDGNYLTPQPTNVCGSSPNPVDYEIMCDFGTTPNTRMVALWDNLTTPPTLKYYTPGANGSLNAYTPVGNVGSCSSTDIEATTNCYKAIASGVGYAAWDILYQVLWWDTSATPPALIATVWRNQTQNTVLATAPDIADLSSCDSATPTQVTATIERLIGVGTITVPAGMRSITVAVNEGAPTVKIGSGPATALVRNLSLSWSGSETGQTLADSFIFTGIAGSDFFVTTTI